MILGCWAALLYVYYDHGSSPPLASSLSGSYWPINMSSQYSTPARTQQPGSLSSMSHYLVNFFYQFPVSQFIGLKSKTLHVFLVALLLNLWTGNEFHSQAPQSKQLLPFRQKWPHYVIMLSRESG